MTGQECLDLLAGVGPGTDVAYRDELVTRFGLEPDRRARTYSTATGRRWPWSPPSPRARRCWCSTSRPAAWTRSWSGSSGGASARRPSGADGLPELPPAGGGGGGLHAGRHPARRPAGGGRRPGGPARLRRSEVVVDLTGPAPELRRLADLPAGRRPALGRRLQLTLSLSARRARCCACWPTPTSPGSTSASPRSRRSSSTTTARPRHDRRDHRAPTAAPTARPRGADRAAVTAPRSVRSGAGRRSSPSSAGAGRGRGTQYRGPSTGAIGVDSLSALAENPAIRTLFGPPVALDDAGRFTVWRTGTVLAVLVGTWAVLAATRLTRGEEEAGRWDLLLAGG